VIMPLITYSREEATTDGWPALGAIAERFPNWAYQSVSAVLVLLLGSATVFLPWGGIRVVVLNQGLYLGPTARVISFAPVVKDEQLVKLTKLADSITEIDGPRTCFRKPGWNAIDCLESANFTAHSRFRSCRGATRGR
jgi:hypothetical protein